METWLLGPGHLQEVGRLSAAFGDERLFLCSWPQWESPDPKGCRIFSVLLAPGRWVLRAQGGDGVLQTTVG